MAVSFDIANIEIPVADDGEQRFKHNSEFMTIANGWDDAVATINGLIDKLNPIIGRINWHVPDIPWTDLEASVVFPLSGNYKRIQANGANCENLDTDGTWQFAKNVSKVSGNLVSTSFRGAAADALATRMEAFAVVVEAAGTAISLAKTAFMGVADVAEEIAVAVEDALVFLGNKLAWLTGDLLSRVSSWIGWAKLAWDITEHGIGVVTDFIDGVEEVINGIQALVKLKDTVSGWADQVKTDLADLHNFVDYMKKLPRLGNDVGLGDLASLNVGDLKKDMATIKTQYGNTEAHGAGTLADVNAQSSDGECHA